MTQRVLVVDNVVRWIGQVRQLLESAGYDVLTARSVADAYPILAQGNVDLAIIDLRLTDETAEGDYSGLELAKAGPPDIPKIIVTGYPTVDAVCEALGFRTDGLPPAVAFVSKQDGLDALLQRVRLALFPWSSSFRAKLLRAFDSQALIKLPERVRELGPVAATQRLSDVIDSQRMELGLHREVHEKAAEHYHCAGLIASAIGGGLLVLAVLLFIFHLAGGAMISVVISVVGRAVELLFSKKEREAHERAQGDFEHLEDLYRAYQAMEWANGLDISDDRDTYRKRVLDRMLLGGTWAIDGCKQSGRGSRLSKKGVADVHGADSSR